MSLAFRESFTSAYLALMKGLSVHLEADKFQTVKRKRFCRCSKAAASQYVKEEAAWNKLKNDFETEDWKKLSTEELANFQLELVKRRRLVRSNISGLKILYVWLIYGLRYISHCQKLANDLRAISSKLNTSQEVVSEVLKKSANPKNTSAYIRELFPELIRKKLPKAENFTDPAQFYLSKQGCKWKMFYLNAEHAVSHLQLSDLSKVSALHSSLITTQFCKQACATASATPSSQVKFLFSADPGRRPSPFSERNLVVVNPNGRAYYFDSAGLCNEFIFKPSASESLLQTQWDELAKQALEERECEAHSRIYRDLARTLAAQKELNLIDRVDNSPKSNTEFFSAHHITDKSPLTDLLPCVSLVPIQRYAYLRAIYIEPETFLLTYKDIPITADTDEIKKNIADIQASSQQKYDAFIDKLNDLKTNAQVKIEHSLTTADCSTTLSKEIHYNTKLGIKKVTIKRVVKGFSADKITQEAIMLCELQEKFDAMPEKFRTNNITFLDPNEVPPSSREECLYAKYRKTNSSLQIEMSYPLLSLDGAVRQTISFEHPDDFDKKLERIKSILYLEKNFKLAPNALNEVSKFTAVEVPPAVPGIDLRKSFSEWFNKISWTQSDLRDGGELLSKELLWQQLSHMIARVEQYLTLGHAKDYLAIPYYEDDPAKGIKKDPEGHRLFYHNFHSLLTHVAKGLQNADADTLKDAIRSLAVGGRYCGGRWMGEALQYYQLLSGEISQIDNKALNERMYFWLDQFKSYVVLRLVSENTNDSQTSHLFTNYVERLTKRGVAKFPVALAAGYNDPFRSTSVDEVKLESDFRKGCSVSEIVLNNLEKLEAALYIPDPVDPKTKTKRVLSPQEQRQKEEANNTGSELSNMIKEAVEKHLLDQTKTWTEKTKATEIERILDDEGYWPYDDDCILRNITVKGSALLLTHVGRIVKNP